MRDETIHPSNQELLLVADGEAPESRAAEIHSHLRACWKCRAQMAQIEKAIVDYVESYKIAERELPPSAGPRALLRARMAEISTNVTRSRWQAFGSLVAKHRLAYASLLIMAGLLGARVLYQHTAAQQSHAIMTVEVLPNPQLTPGATRTVATSELCSMSHDEVIRRVPAALQRQVFSEYGVPSARAGEYEVDYLITPGLGGADDIRNLWPEPQHDTAWNSYVKDQLEEHLHDMVCSGELDLATAQRQIAGNWIVAYKKYFDADPQPLHLQSGRPPDVLAAWGIVYFHGPQLLN